MPICRRLSNRISPINVSTPMPSATDNRMLIPFLYIPCLILFCRFQIDHSGFPTSFIHTQPPSITQMRPQLAINSTSVLSSAQLLSIDKRRNILIGSFHEIHDVFRVLTYHGIPKLPLGHNRVPSQKLDGTGFFTFSCPI